MTGNRAATLVICGLIALAGCQTTANNNDVPARISNPSAESRAALQKAVNDALHTEVLLADDALTRSSILIIERSPPRTMQDLPATGRNMDPPVQFRLVTSDSACILIDTRDGSRHLLENTTCVAE
jgi:hypothetical protein